MTTLVDCPQSNAFEWRFRLFGTDVSVKIWFWIVLLVLGGEQPPAAMGIWIAVCFCSILVHEFGHVFAFRLFGTDAEVVLYGWGGMAIPRRRVGNSADLVVSLAGPAAGFCIAAVTLIAARSHGALIHFGWHMCIPTLAVLPRGSWSNWYILMNDLMFVNFYWGLLNLLPVHPLDGGHAARALWEQHDPYRGRKHSLVLSAIVAGVSALLGIAEQNMGVVLVFAVLAVSSIQLLESANHGPLPYRRW
jgi:stage IV sporulation protein FB